MITPLGWLERVPTYKDQQQKLADRDLSNLRLPRLSADAGGRHPDLPRQHGAGGRGPGLAHRAHARDRAALQPHLRPRAGLRGEGRGGGQEARQQEGEALRASCARRSRSRATTEALDGGARAARTTRRTCRSATASGCSAISRASRRVILPEPQALLTETPKRAGPRRPEDVEVATATRSCCARSPRRSRRRSARCRPIRRACAAPIRAIPEKCPVWPLHQIYSDARHAGLGGEGLHAPPASAASNASSR